MTFHGRLDNLPAENQLDFKVPKIQDVQGLCWVAFIQGFSVLILHCQCNLNIMLFCVLEAELLSARLPCEHILRWCEYFLRSEGCCSGVADRQDSEWDGTGMRPVTLSF